MGIGGEMVINRWALFGLAVLFFVSSYRMSVLIYDQHIHCEAAKETVLEETDLIAASGGMPSEKMTNRWRDLLRGC